MPALVQAALVEWTALGNAALYAFVAALLITGLFTTGVELVEPRGGEAAGSVRKAAAGVVFLACLAIVAFGLHVMFTSK